MIIIQHQGVSILSGCHPFHAIFCSEIEVQLKAAYKVGEQVTPTELKNIQKTRRTHWRQRIN